MELRFKQNNVHSCRETPAACEKASEISLLIRAKQRGKTIAGFFSNFSCNYGSELLIGLRRGHLHGNAVCGFSVNLPLTCVFRFPVLLV